MTVAKYATVVLGAIAVAGVVIWTVPHWKQERCVSEGGKWLSAHSRCQTVACVDTGTCLPNYNNSVVCESLPVGIDERQLVFALGKPVRVDKNVLFFEPSATESRLIRVALDDQRRARELSCRGGA